MEEQSLQSPQKRNIAYKARIGTILAGRPVIEGERLRYLEVSDKKFFRINVIANIVDKYIQEGEKKYGTITIDDASGQLRVKLFGEDVDKFSNLNQGDTVLVIGLLRSWNNELYITPEIIKKKEPAYLLVRKLELDLEQPKIVDKIVIAELRDRIVSMVKEAEKNGGVDIEKIIIESHEPPEIINQEIKKLLEDGIAYEPRPGKLRYLG
ncbi:MAG: OB-fold nucleic acid binding domain-containing protein [Nanoarchaeota archaeon]